MHENEKSEVWVQDLADRNLFFNRLLNLKLTESALQSRSSRVLKIMYDTDTHPVLPFGYVWNHNEQVAIDPAQADIIRQIFAWAGQGLFAEKIVKKCESIADSTGEIVWHPSLIRQILKNEQAYRSGVLRSDSSVQLPPILK